MVGLIISSKKSPLGRKGEGWKGELGEGGWKGGWKGGIKGYGRVTGERTEGRMDGRLRRVKFKGS